MDTIIDPARRLRGTVRVPGDKSIAHRALLLGALAEEAQVIEGLPDAGDVRNTVECLRALGCRVERGSDGHTTVQGAFHPSGEILNAGNSGTTARLMAGLLAGQGLEATLDGDESLRQRPMLRVAAPLRLMGAEIETVLRLSADARPERGAAGHQLPPAGLQRPGEERDPDRRSLRRRARPR